MCAQSLNQIWFFATPWTVVHQAPLSHGISQARILEWVAISFSKGTSRSNLHLWYLWHRQADSFPLCHLGCPVTVEICIFKMCSVWFWDTASLENLSCGTFSPYSEFPEKAWEPRLRAGEGPTNMLTHILEVSNTEIFLHLKKYIYAWLTCNYIRDWSLLRSYLFY